jgi:hypothetical protein
MLLIYSGLKELSALSKAFLPAWFAILDIARRLLTLRFRLIASAR